MSTGSLLRTYLLPQWRLLLVLGLLMALTIGLRLVNPQIVRAFLDSAVSGAAQEALFGIGAVFLASALTVQLAAIAETYVAESLGLTATNWLRADLTLHVLRLDSGFHGQHTPGELIERTDGDVATLANFFSRFVVSLLGNALLLIGILVMLLQVDLRIGGVAVGFTALAGLLIASFRQAAVVRFQRVRQATAELFGLIEERIAGTEDVRANGAVPYVMRRFLQRSRDLVWGEVHALLALGATIDSAMFCLGMATAAMLAIGAWLYSQGQMSIGTVYMIFAYCQTLHQPLVALVRQMEDLQQAMASIRRIQTLLSERPSIVDGDRAPLPSGPLETEVESLTFGYDGGRPVLRDVSFALRPGEVLGLLGRTGSGKTTLTRLLFRLYDPQQGTIRAGGAALRDLRVDDLRAHIGLVTQDVQLFHASVRDNITFFDSFVSDERLAAVLRELGLTEWVGRLPNGLDTLVGPGGSRLSAGEAQLVAFARVYLRDPGLVILDEASSRLDPATELILERAVDRLLDGRTAIVVAHRLSTLERANRILILEEGRVVEAGGRAQLTADPASHFSALLRSGLSEVLA